MQAQHAAEVMAIGQAAAFGDLLNALSAMAQHLAGGIETVAQQDAHRGLAAVLSEEMVEVASAQAGVAGNLRGAELQAKVLVHEFHGAQQAGVEVLFLPGAGGHLAQNRRHQFSRGPRQVRLIRRGLPLLQFPEQGALRWLDGKAVNARSDAVVGGPQTEVAVPLGEGLLEGG